MNCEFTFGNLILLALGFLYIFLNQKILKKYIGAEKGAIIGRFACFSIVLHLFWGLIVCILFNEKYYFLVFDDETYFEYASGNITEGMLESTNSYYYMLYWLYNFFGSTTLTGRIVNSIISISIIYPIAYIEKFMLSETKFWAAKFYAISPFIIFISFFEIKDIFLTYTFILSYLMVKIQEKRINIYCLFLLIILSIINEGFRSGTGVLPLTVLALNQIFKIEAKSKYFVASIFVLAIALFVYQIYGREYWEYGYNRVDRYQNWIYTQFSGGAIYGSLIISEVGDLWKFPICYLVYALQPLNVYPGDLRFFNDFGIIMKAIDTPILIFSIVFLPFYILKERWNSLFFIVFYSFNSCINLTNARQSFFLYPIMYIIFFDTYHRISKLNNSYLSTKNLNVVIVFVYAVWICYVFYRIQIYMFH